MRLTRLLSRRSAASEESQTGRDARKPEAPSAAKLQRAFEQEMPDVAFVKARRAYFESVGQPVVDRARYFVLCVVLGAVVLALAWAIVQMMPLKEVRPWVVKVDEVRGQVELDKDAASSVVNYEPGRAVLERELFTFVQQLWSINADAPELSEVGHKEAYLRTRGKATSEFRDFMSREQVYQRIKTTPGLVRSVERRTISFQGGGEVALVRFDTVERTRAQPQAIRRQWLMLVQFRQIALTDAAEIEANPLGLFITHFEISEER